MTLYTALIILLVIGIGMWLIWKYVPQPPKFILLIILGIGLVLWMLNLLGLFAWLHDVTVK